MYDENPLPPRDYDIITVTDKDGNVTYDVKIFEWDDFGRPCLIMIMDGFKTEKEAIEYANSRM